MNNWCFELKIKIFYQTMIPWYLCTSSFFNSINYYTCI